MILFYAAGASSLAPHILLREAALSFSLEKVDLLTKQWSGGDYDRINSKSYVPALRLADGAVLTECAVILQYVADQAPNRDLIPPAGSLERYRSMAWLNYLATEVHKNFITPERAGGVSANFLSKTKEGQAATRKHVAPRLSYIDRELGDRNFLMGSKFSAPDAYLFAMLTWARRLDFDISIWPKLATFFERVNGMPSVRETMDVEGPPHSLAAR